MTHPFTRCLALTIALLAVARPAYAESWRAPVEGRVTRGFGITGTDRFAPGQHRGADFAAAPGSAVRAACSGRVLVAGRVGSSGRVVTVRCGRWRVTHMPLAAVTVHTGRAVHRGATIGTVAPSSAHAGLHLGARREGDTFGYTDPLRFITTARRLPPPVITHRIARRPPAAPPHPAPVRPAPVRPALHRPAKRRAAPHLAVPPPGLRVPPPARAAPRGGELAPWSAWAGLASLLTGAFGTGLRVRTRRRAVVVADPIVGEAS